MYREPSTNDQQQQQDPLFNPDRADGQINALAARHRAAVRAGRPFPFDESELRADLTARQITTETLQQMLNETQEWSP